MPLLSRRHQPQQTGKPRVDTSGAASQVHSLLLRLLSAGFSLVSEGRHPLLRPSKTVLLARCKLVHHSIAGLLTTGCPAQLRYCQFYQEPLLRHRLHPALHGRTPKVLRLESRNTKTLGPLTIHEDVLMLGLQAQCPDPPSHLSPSFELYLQVTNQAEVPLLHLPCLAFLARIQGGLPARVEAASRSTHLQERV